MVFRRGMDVSTWRRPCGMMRHGCDRALCALYAFGSVRTTLYSERSVRLFGSTALVGAFAGLRTSFVCLYSLPLLACFQEGCAFLSGHLSLSYLLYMPLRSIACRAAGAVAFPTGTGRAPRCAVSFPALFSPLTYASIACMRKKPAFTLLRLFYSNTNKTTAVVRGGLVTAVEGMSPWLPVAHIPLAQPSAACLF